AYDVRDGDLAEVVRQAVALIAPVAGRDGVEVTLREGMAHAPARIDRGALLQALLNVLDNARKYAAAGQRIEVSTGREGDALCIVVRDHGPGVPTGERESIFGRFRRGEQHRHGSIPGVGLGLYLARQICERHGGALACAVPDDGGKGAQFAFTLPLAMDDGGDA